MLTPSDTEHERFVASIHAFYLGLGLLALDGSYQYREVGAPRGKQLGGPRMHTAYGELSPTSAAYLFAVQLAVRALDEERVNALLVQVSDEHRDAVREILPTLDRDDLIARLGLPPPEEWPAAE